MATLTYEEVAWMKPLPCGNYPRQPLTLGKLVDHDNTLVVSLPPKGECVLYCMAHQMIYKPNETCPGCAVQDVNPA